MSKQQANKLTKKKLLGALAAGAASVYGQTDAEAGIQYTDSTANPVTSDANTTGDTFWDIDGDGTIDEAVIKNESSSKKTFAGLEGRFSFASTQNGLLLALSSGQTVGTGLNFDNRAELLFYSALRSSTSGFLSGVENYFGFKLSASGSTYYGWAKTTLTDSSFSPYGTMTISEWAYNDVAGASITVGDTGNSAVPEPSSFAITGLGLLAAGAGGVRRWRREKKDKAS